MFARFRWTPVWAGLCALALVVAPVTAQPQGGCVELPTLGGWYTKANDVNSRGQIVGYGLSADGTGFALMWETTGGITGPEILPVGGITSEAVAINDPGHVVGTLVTEENAQVAYLWVPNRGAVHLPTLGGSWMTATDINNQDQVVGYGETETGAVHGWLWSERTGIVNLGTLIQDAESSVAMAINAGGDVVGYAVDATGGQRAVLWPAGGAGIYVGGLDGVSWAHDINDRREIVGGVQYDVPYWMPTHAFLWTERDGMVDLGTLGGGWSEAWGINNQGMVVGYSADEESIYRAFYWTARSGMQALESAGAFSGAYAVSNSGRVVGEVSTDEGITLACLWSTAGQWISQRQP